MQSVCEPIGLESLRDIEESVRKKPMMGMLLVCLFVCLFICLFVCLFVCLSVCLSVCLFVVVYIVYVLFVYLRCDMSTTTNTKHIGRNRRSAERKSP